jgi:hypothetical protein
LFLSKSFIRQILLISSAVWFAFFLLPIVWGSFPILRYILGYPDPVGNFSVARSSKTPRNSKVQKKQSPLLAIWNRNWSILLLHPTPRFLRPLPIRLFIDFLTSLLFNTTLHVISSTPKLSRSCSGNYSPISQRSYSPSSPKNCSSLNRGTSLSSATPLLPWKAFNHQGTTTGSHYNHNFHHSSGFPLIILAV